RSSGARPQPTEYGSGSSAHLALRRDRFGDRILRFGQKGLANPLAHESPLPGPDPFSLPQERNAPDLVQLQSDLQAHGVYAGGIGDCRDVFRASERLTLGSRCAQSRDDADLPRPSTLDHVRGRISGADRTARTNPLHVLVGSPGTPPRPKL